MVSALAIALGLAFGAAEETVTVPYESPDVSGLHFAETFDGEVWSRWSHATADKYTGKFEVSTRSQEALVGDLGLQAPEAAKHYGAAVKFDPVNVKDGDSFAVQFEAKFQEGLTCGGSYIKLFDSEGKSPEQFHADTRYVIMFGPDRCGATNKVHFILQHKNPVSGKWEEKHLTTPPLVPSDKRTHLYSVLLRPDNSIEVQVDGDQKFSGSLLKDLTPPVNPPKEIDDPSDSKPADWVDEAKMDDPEAFKPDDWDEDAPARIEDPAASMPSGWLEGQPLKIPDPKSKRPDDWDDEEDGEWEAPIIDNPMCTVGCGKWQAPMITNPDYKGKWYAPKIDNPAYIGEWKPRQIANPEFFEDEKPYQIPTIDSIGIDIWTMDKGIMFDNIVVDKNPSKVIDFGKATFGARSAIEAKQDVSSSGGGAFRDYLDWVLSNPVPVLVTILVLLTGSFLLCCRTPAPAAPAPTVGAAESSQATPKRKTVREYSSKARSESPSGKRADKEAKEESAATTSEQDKKED